MPQLLRVHTFGQARKMGSSVEEQVAQFVVMLGDCCDSARIAHLAMQVELNDGTVVAGVPTEPHR